MLGIQLAVAAGASVVVGAVRTPEHAALVENYGATHVVATASDEAAAAAYGRYDIILESIGGASLATSLGMLAPGGVCVLFGATESHEAHINAGALYRTAGTSLYGFLLFDELTRTEPARIGLARLVDQVVARHLEPLVSVEASWTDVAKVARSLIDRAFPGKAVLHLSHA